MSQPAMPPGKPLCAGYLTKLGFNSGKWQRRYFMLTDQTLAYYSDMGGKEKGQIDVTKLLQVEEVKPGAIISKEACTTTPRKPIGNFTIKVTARQEGGYRSFYLSAGGPEDYHIWVAHLTALKDGKRKTKGGQAKSQPTSRSTSQNATPGQPQPAQQASRAAPAGTKPPQGGQPTGAKPKAAVNPTIVPASEQTTRLDIKRQPWFQPEWTEAQTDAFLATAPQGAFVIRNAPKKPGSFALAIQASQGRARVLLAHHSFNNKNYWSAQPHMYFEHLLDLVTYYCRKPLHFKQWGNEGQLLSLTAVRQAVLQQPQAANGGQQGVPRAQSVSVAAPAPAPAAQAPVNPALAGKANEVRELRNLVTKALQQVSNDAIIAKRVDQRLEATKVDSEIAIKGTSMALSHSRKTLDQQAEQAAKLDAAKAAEVNEMISTARSTLAELEKHANQNSTEIERLLSAAAKSLSMVAGLQSGREPSLKSATFMLELAEKSLAGGADPGDIRSNIHGLLASADQTANQVKAGVQDAQHQLDEIESLMGHDYSLEKDLEQIARAMPAEGGSAADVNVNELVADLVDEGSDVLDIFMPSTTSAAHSEPGVNAEDDEDDDDDEEDQEGQEEDGAANGGQQEADDDDEEPPDTTVSTAISFAPPTAGDDGEEDHDDDADSGDGDNEDMIDLTAAAAPAAPAPASEARNPADVAIGEVADPSLTKAMASLSHGDQHSQAADEAAKASEDRERHASKQKKHEAETAEVIAFIEGALQRKLPDQHISDVLHNGVVLCELMQVLQPGSIAKINKSEMRFQQMENIGNFLSAVEVYGVRPSDSFQTVDLYEKQNIFQVVNTLVHLKNTASKKGFVAQPFTEKQEGAAATDASAGTSQPSMPDPPAAKAPAIPAHTATNPAPATPPPTPASTLNTSTGAPSTSSAASTAVTTSTPATQPAAPETTENTASTTTASTDKNADKKGDETATSSDSSSAAAPAPPMGSGDAVPRGLSMSGKALPMPKKLQKK